MFLFFIQIISQHIEKNKVIAQNVIVLDKVQCIR